MKKKKKAGAAVVMNYAMKAGCKKTPRCLDIGKEHLTQKVNDQSLYNRAI